ncbi:SusC/RagA family TonB-linked outer membrane protein [Longibacter sp.]|uniref:SusC/RagA family TonB-linked outer membrane protein n=1 Tax=Longibacter sp. TaxID=2045415 RepID=UPI003EBB1AF1
MLAQDGTISGTVTDGQTGDPLPGATVQVQELGIGSATDVDGNYELSVPEGDHVVTASFVGYNPTEKTVTVTAGETTSVDFALAPRTEELDEIVVTALGIEEEERSLGYASQDVSGEEIAEAAEQNVTNALLGKVAGVQINQSNGQAGGSSRIVIRGNNSYVGGGNSPLIVVDGQPISNAEDDNPIGPDVFTGGTSNRLLDIDPNSIESLNVLKGASATALYGSRAANGAIIITTKSGSGAEGVRASFTTSGGFNDVIIDGYQDRFLQGTSECYTNGVREENGGYAEFGDPNSQRCFDEVGGPGTGGVTQIGRSFGPARDAVSQAVLDSIGQPQIFDPREDFYENGTNIENSLTISGSGDFGNANLTVSDARNQGIVPTNFLNRTSVQGKYTADLSEKMTVQLSSNYTETNRRFMLEANGPNSFQWSLQNVPISFDITETTYPDGTQRTYNTGSRDNPLWLSERINLLTDVDRFIGNANVSYDILPWLEVRERIGVDTYSQNFQSQIADQTAAEPGGSTADQQLERREINSDLTVTAKRNITEDLGMTLLVGNNISKRTVNANTIEAVGTGIPGFYNISVYDNTTPTQFREEQVLIGAYSRLSLNYRDYAYLQVSARNDWSSTLPLDENSYFYPGVSGSFVFTEAFSDTFEDTFLSFGKIRASLAQVGSDTGPYELVTVFPQADVGDGVRGDITFPFRDQNSFLQDFARANPDLKPEISTEYELGTDLRFFNNRATLDFTFYNKLTRDQIFSVPQSAASGFSSQVRNAGEIRNKGFEVLLSGTPLEVGDFTWDLSVNWSKNTTTVEELSEGVESIFLFGFTSIQVRAETGEDGYGIIFGSRYLRNGEISEDTPVTINGQQRTSPVEGFGDDALIITADGTPLEADSPGSIGNVQPDWTGGLRSTFSFKGLTLTQQWEISQGGDILNFDNYYVQATGNIDQTLDRGSEEIIDGIRQSDGQRNEGENAVGYERDEAWFRGTSADTDRFVFERYVEDASYVKLRELTLAYRFTLPEGLSNRSGLDNVRFALTGRNLLTFSDFTYGDPAGSLDGAGNGQGFYHGVTPTSRQYRASLTLGF